MLRLIFRLLLRRLIILCNIQIVGVMPHFLILLSDGSVPACGLCSACRALWCGVVGVLDGVLGCKVFRSTGPCLAVFW
jgi:hypothetical protein